MKGKLYLMAAMLLCLASLNPVSGQVCDCATTGNCPVGIEDNGTFQGTLDVTVNGPNDLGQCPLTSLCFTIEHTWVGDLSVSLTSPSGLNYLVMADANNGSGGCGTNADNIDVCIVPGAFNPLTGNSEYNCNTGGCSVGTCCLNGAWTMPCGGVTDPVSGATQAPNCNLADFNGAGSPANGTWTLTINDICGSDVGQLINFSLTFACGASCISCEADGGTLNDPDVQGCQGSASLNLNPIPVYSGNPPPDPGQYGYNWVIANANGTITNVNPTANMSNFPPGSYTLCGFSYILSAQGNLNSLVGQNLTSAQNQFDSPTAPFCGSFSDDCINVTIGPPIPPSTLDTFVCLGQCLDLGGNLVCASGPVIFQSYLGCDSIVNVNLTIVQPITTNETVTICAGECIFANNQSYCPPGPAIYSLPNWQGCDSTIILTFNEIVTVAIINPASPPPLSCNDPFVILDGFGSVPSNVTYSWQGPNGFFSDDGAITVDQPGDYTLTVINAALNPPCTSTATVTVDGAVLPPDLQLNSPPPGICAGDFFDLTTLQIIDLNNTNPVITFHSDTPATPFNELPSTSVSPLSTTTYYALGTSGNCSSELPITITVTSLPVANFTATSPICISNSSIVTFTGIAPPNSTYNWNFGGGTASPGSGPGPHIVTWGTGGTKTITLVVDANGCQSSPESQTVEVGTQIPPPVINCTSTSNSITFTWDPVPGATGYSVTVINGPTGTMNGPESYVVTNLNPNQQVTISVTAFSGNSCPDNFAQLSCTAQDCPPVTVTIAPVPDFCLTSTTGTFVLTASQMGGAGGGAFTWSGPGVNPITGIFNPANANPGANTIVVTYEEGTCTYNASIVINVYPTPSATFTATSPICSSNSTTVNYTGNASNAATFTWNFGGGAANPGTGPGPHSVTWPTGGTYTVSLMVAENGCNSSTSSQAVVVGSALPQPQINCNTTTNSVEFVWDDIPGASGYTVTVVTGGTGVATSDTSMLFSGLNPGDAITIQVTALDPGPCNDVTAQATCIAQDCPSVNINITPVDDICLNANATPVSLQANVTGGAGGGTLTWVGTGVSPGGVFTPQQATLGANLITVLYEEGDCTYSEDITIDVIAQPVASFTAPSPICTNQNISVSYAGMVQPGLTFDWDFGTANATPGVGQGPHLVQWAAGGPQPITLTVTTAQGCASEPFTTNVQVDEPLIAPIITCATTTNSIEFTWPNVVGATSYVATLISGTPGIQTSQNSYTINGLQPGDQATISLTISNGGACPDATVQQSCIAQDCLPVTIAITPVDDICFDANATPVTLQATPSTTGGSLVWSGDGVSPGGIFNPQVGLGANLLTATYTLGDCIYTQTTTINVLSVPIASFTAPSTVCEGEDATVTFAGTALPNAIFDWDFGTGTATPGTGIGPHTVSWPSSGPQQISLTVTSAQGCVSEPMSENIQVQAPLLPPIVNCNTTLSSVEFSWPDVAGATDYDVVVVSGSTGVQTSQNTYEVTGLVPNGQVTIALTVSNNGPCPPVTVQQTCIAQDCLPIVASLDPVVPICLGSVNTVQLTATLTGAAGGGTATWSGPGTSVSGVFNPATAGVGTHPIVYTYIENNCTYQAGGNVQVLPTPTANFTATDEICVTDAATVTYSGNAPSSAIYTWNFDGGTATPGTGQGPHQVGFPAPGNYDVLLTVTQDGCTSTQVTQSVQVDPELTAPDIDCNTTVSSIEFTWDAVPNATDYEVTVLSGQSGLQSSPTSYSLTGLQPNETVTIEIVVSGNTVCPSITVEQTCTAVDCPAVTIDLAPVDPICLTASAGTVQLQATVTGGTGTTGTWSGPGVSANGTFNPNTAGVGTHVLTFVYEENSSCSYDETTQVQVVAAPVADAGPDGEITCKDNQSSVQLGGPGTSTGPSITYEWTTGGAPIPAGSDTPNPVVTLPGTYTLTVTNTALASCSDADDATVLASTDIPQPEVTIVPISCYGENDGAISVVNVTGGEPPYLYSLNGGDYGPNGNFTGLAPGIYVVSVIDASGCEATVTIDITQPQELNVELIAIVEGGGNIIRLGDTTQLQALVSLPPDSLDNITWHPAALVSCDTCLNVFISPTRETTFTITVESNGCVDSDNLTLFVRKDHPIYVPNAFSPNGDNNNDLFMIYGGKEVAKIRSFLVFSRWGETVFQYYLFPPNEPAYGWDGKYRGEPMNSAVFTWFAEVEFVDGVVELFEGSVTLKR
ncbi:MAG: gliding motility-associated C-terminal domain-containing protein [Saprospiraceae bacterium]|nr:gliding motility-associated C-terminal domain-containing protein [Saprospiraceae bacterium]